MVAYRPIYDSRHLQADCKEPGLVRNLITTCSLCMSRYSFRVVAVDAGTPALSSSVVVVVDLQDVNDHRPSFLQPRGYSFQLAENLPAGTELGAVSNRSVVTIIDYYSTVCLQCIDAVGWAAEKAPGL